MAAYRQQGLRNRDARRARIDRANELIAKMREAKMAEARGVHEFDRDPGTGRCAKCGRQARSH